MKKVQKNVGLKKVLIVGLGVIAIIVFMFIIVLRSMLFRPSVSVTVSHEACDIDFDEDCDKIDYWLAKKAVGYCVNDKPRFIFFGYISVADADHDGCVTDSDLENLFPEANN